MPERTGRGRRGSPPTRAERRAVRASVTDPAVPLDAAARLLEARPRSVTEVRGRLLGAGYVPSLVEQVLARLIAAGYLDDAAFARAWVESRDRAHPRGEAALRRELQRRGVDRDVVDAVLAARREGATSPGEGRAEASGAPVPAPPAADPDELAAERLIARRSAALARITDPRVRRQRAYALLARNGFDPDVCRAVAGRLPEAPAGDLPETPAPDGTEGEPGPTASRPSARPAGHGRGGRRDRAVDPRPGRP